MQVDLKSVDSFLRLKKKKSYHEKNDKENHTHQSNSQKWYDQISEAWDRALLKIKELAEKK
jgi:hypothetical protein